MPEPKDMQTEAIAILNDKFRKGDYPSNRGDILFTRGLVDYIASRNEGTEDVAPFIRDYSDFTEDNDPHGERDFGSFVYGDKKCFWKIDYYDPTQTMHSEDPADIEKTHRVLTVMLANEY